MLGNIELAVTAIAHKVSVETFVKKEGIDRTLPSGIIDHEEEIGRPPSSNVEVKTEKIDESARYAKKAPVLINQKGEAVIFTYDGVKAEMQELVSKDEFTDQFGFAKAREIVLSYGVGRLEDVPRENYPELVTKVRKAISEWK